VRVENIQEPADHVPAVLERVKPEFIAKTYQVSTWTDTQDFLEQLGRRMGRLLKVSYNGGCFCCGCFCNLHSIVIMVVVSVVVVSVTYTQFC